MSPSYKLVITGASGFVGQQLIPRLTDAGCTLLLIGRNTDHLQTLYPGHSVQGYESWTKEASGFDAILNLAVLNNDVRATQDAFNAVNADLAERIALKGLAVGITHFIQLSSIHALDERNHSNYAESKRLAQIQLAEIPGLTVTTLYCPLIYAGEWPRSLQRLNRFPKPIANALFKPLAALKPTVHVNYLAHTVITAIRDPGSEYVVADDIDTNAWYQVTSIVMNMSAAVFLAIFLGWLLLLIALIIRVTSRGPAIFAQTRLGKNGQSFTCYKFRTMVLGTPQVGTHDIQASSITPVGSFLRRTKLDELPQIVNILKGEMRLVGPRPGLPVQTELRDAREKQGVMTLPPGITGWSQIHDVDMSDPEKLATWDARYKGMRSILLDLKIILATVFGRGQGDRVGR